MIAVLAEYVDDAVLVILLTLCQATQHTTVNDYWTPLSLVERTEKDSTGFKRRKLAYYGHTTKQQGSCLEKEIMQGTMPGARRQEDHAWPGWTTSRRGQDSPWKSQSE